METKNSQAALRKRLAIPESRLDAVNAALLDPDSPIMRDFLAEIGRAHV